MKKNKIIIISLCVLSFWTITYGVFENIKSENYKIMLKNTYEKNFYDATTYVNNTNNLLSKINIVSDPSLNSELFAEIWKQSQTANQSFASLPYDLELVTSTMKFLSQTSDLSYSLLKKSLNGHPLNTEDINNIDVLQTYSGKLSEELNNFIMISQVSGGREWTKIIEKHKQSTNPTSIAENISLATSITRVNENFQDYPSLVYDGPFSEHVKQNTPKFLENKEEISLEEAAARAEKILSPMGIFEIENIGQSNPQIKNTVEVYSFQGKSSEYAPFPNIFIDITKKGGYPLWFIRNTDLTYVETPLTISHAIEEAVEFLSSNNYTNMKYSYYEIYQNTVLINFASTENDTTLYSDLIKVKVSLTDGQIIGLESMGYIMMHGPRNLAEPLLTVDQAKAQINPDFKVESANKALIPLNSGKEVLCYEFLGKYKDKTFLVYVNAETGKTENVLQLLISPNGVLAI